VVLEGVFTSFVEVAPKTYDTDVVFGVLSAFGEGNDMVEGFVGIDKDTLTDRAMGSCLLEMVNEFFGNCSIVRSADIEVSLPFVGQFFGRWFDRLFGKVFFGWFQVGDDDAVSFSVKAGSVFHRVHLFFSNIRLMISLRYGCLRAILRLCRRVLMYFSDTPRMAASSLYFIFTMTTNMRQNIVIVKEYFRPRSYIGG
jgi:hypothetical protein